MGRFATGVTVVTTTHKDTIHGMTANAFLSVSLRPPLVLVSLGRCRMSEMLPRTGRYGVSVLASDQEDFAAHFAGQRVSPRRPRVRLGARSAAARAGPWPTSAAGSSTSTPPATTCCGSARWSTSATVTASRCCSTRDASARCARSPSAPSSAERAASGGRSARRSRRRLRTTSPIATATTNHRTAWPSESPNASPAPLPARARTRLGQQPGLMVRSGDISCRRRSRPGSRPGGGPAGRPATATSAGCAADPGRAPPARAALVDQLDQRRQRAAAGDAQQLGRHAGLRGPPRGRPHGVEILLVRERRVLAREHQRRRMGRQPQHVGHDQPVARGLHRAVDRHPLGARIDADRQRGQHDRRGPPGGALGAGRCRALTGGRRRSSSRHDDRPRSPGGRLGSATFAPRVQTCAKCVDLLCTNWYNGALRRRGM